MAGPNGAAKSTAAPELLHEELGISEFVNADVIARGLSAFDPAAPIKVYDRHVWAEVQRLGTQ